MNDTRAVLLEMETLIQATVERAPEAAHESLRQRLETSFEQFKAAVMNPDVPNSVRQSALDELQAMIAKAMAELSPKVVEGAQRYQTLNEMKRDGT